MTHPSDAEVAEQISDEALSDYSDGASFHAAIRKHILAALARVRRETWEEAANVAKPKHRHCMHKKCEGAWEIERMLRSRADEERK